MTDQGLLLFGVGVSFVFAAGVYLFLRERFESGPQEAPLPIERASAALRDARGET
ncbi:MAG TPA: hypothetical protein VII72_21950 [Myxococcota bacterium]|jgi:hypothetical protein